ncbi:MAG: DUF4831 family protein [Bacteroidales bacterium]|nr:DUF4831 family protein [Bacteroidales bacterium]
MKTIYLTWCLAFLACLPLMAQTEVVAYKPGVTTEGVTYYLPRTAFAISIKLKKTTYFPGEFQPYAAAYLRLADVGATPTTSWSIEGISVQPYGLPDTSKVYSIALKKRTIAPLVTLSVDGLLLGVNTADAPSVAPLPEPLPLRTRTPKPLNPRDYMGEDILLAGSTLKMAELTANEILDLRDSRNLLMKGQADFMPKDGEQLKLMLAQLDQQEQALLQAFKGYTTEEEQTVVLRYEPMAEVKDHVLCRLSQKLGLVAPDDLAGAPIYISLTDLKSLPDSVPLDPKAIAKRDAEDVRYNLPTHCRLEIYTPTQHLYTGQQAVAQLGRVEYLGGALFNKNATTKLTLVPTTGAVLQLEAIQQP